jgi:hypothetical protein
MTKKSILIKSFVLITPDIQNRVHVEALSSDWALLWVLGASHMEGHSVREDPDLLEAQLTFAYLALSVLANHQISCL